MVDPVAAGGVVGALAAASPALTKFIETCSSGLGRLYEPTHQRRLAHAEADRMIILANAAAEVAGIERRAVDRFIAVEATRQENMEAIADQARDQLPPQVSSTPVEPGWAAKFFDSCKDVSQEDLQTVWARLLAGEVASPGSFSLRTLQVLATMSSREAKLFDALCSLMIHETGPFIFDEREAFLRAKGLDFTARQLLVQAGLIQVHPQGVRRAAHLGALFLHPIDGGPLLVGLSPTPAQPTEIQLGTVLLTQAGKELSKLWRGDFDAEHADWVLQRFLALGWQMGKVQRDRQPGGIFLSHEYPEFMVRFIKDGGLMNSTC